LGANIRKKIEKIYQISKKNTYLCSRKPETDETEPYLPNYYYGHNL
jgi:hypothetical protein